jgi:hypothetical protein
LPLKNHLAALVRTQGDAILLNVEFKSAWVSTASAPVPTALIPWIGAVTVSRLWVADTFHVKQAPAAKVNFLARRGKSAQFGEFRAIL